MPFKSQAPDIREETGPMEGTIATHPAFAQIRASRISGDTALYGSDFIHHNCVEIKISASELHRSHSRDWYFARNELIAVRLSEAQWATFVSTLNGSSDNPCTLVHERGTYMPDIAMPPRVNHFHEEMQASIRKVTDQIDAAIRELDAELGTSVSNKKKEAVMGRLRSLRQQVHSNIPFVAKSLEEHMENTVEKAKVEVHAHIENTVRRAGFQALNNGEGLLQLPSATNDPAS